jgi:hypothetical protein
MVVPSDGIRLLGFSPFPHAATLRYGFVGAPCADDPDQDAHKTGLRFLAFICCQLLLKVRPAHRAAH